jgi:hypothetical protein
MDSTIVFYLFLTIVFGLMLLALVLGYQNTERERLREKEQRTAKQVPSVENMVAFPRFIDDSNSRRPRSTQTPFDDAVVVNLESYLRSEREVVTQFINDPSVDSLYREMRISAQPN